MNIMTKGPQGPVGIMGSGFRLFNAAFKDNWLLALGAGLLGSWWGGYAADLGDNAWVQLQRAPAWVAFLALACNVAATLVSLVMVRRIDNIARGLLPDLADEFYVALHALPGFLLASLVYAAVILLGLIVFIVPGLLLMVYFGFYGYAMVLQEQGPFKALGSSFRLVDGQGAHPFFACFLVLMLVLAIAVPVFLALGAMYMALQGVVAPAGFPAWPGEALFGAAGNMMLEPLGIAMSLSIYYELRVRKKVSARSD